MNLENYPNKEAVWGYDEITRLIQSRIETMPDLPKRVAVVLSWSDDDDKAIQKSFASSGGAYDILAMKWLDKPFRLFFFALSPDSPMNGDDFLDALTASAFAECFLLHNGKATLRTIKLESVEEAKGKHSQALMKAFSRP